MKKQILKVMIALVAIVMPNLVYAQSQEAAGIYNGELAVSLFGFPAGSSTENVYLTTVDETHIALEIKDFKFATNGVVIEIGDILIPNVQLQEEGNTIVILPADVKLMLPAPINSVDVHLNRSTIVDKKLVLTLVVKTIYPASMDVEVKFDGMKTDGSGIQDITTVKPTVYYNTTTGSLIVKGAEHQKYDIYNVTGMHTLSGILNAEEINVSGLSKGIYLIKIENNTMKFIKR